MKTWMCFSSFLVLVLLVRCTNESPLEPDFELVVIQGYLYANEAVDDIQITSTLPLGSEETSAPPINDAEVWLTKDGQRYDLEPSPGDSGYYHYAGNDLTVEAGDFFEIHVDYYDRIASGETVVPAPPENVTLSSDTLYVPEIENMFDFHIDSTRHVLTVTWTKESSALFFVTVECVESDPDSIDLFGGMFGREGLFMSGPTNSNEYNISFMTVACYGEHRLRVYRVNQEYADLYTSRQQDSRDLNEPLTNIESGLGIFTAFNGSDYLAFQVVPE